MFHFELKTSLKERRYSTKSVVKHEINLILFLNSLCEELNESGELEFLVGGFGLENWLLDIDTDLCVILEQLPSFFNSILFENNGELDFYEQGVERILDFKIQDNQVKIECFSYSNWRPSPSIEIISFEYFYNLFYRFLNDFNLYTKHTFPNYYHHSIYSEHFNGLLETLKKIYKKTSN